MSGQTTRAEVRFDCVVGRFERTLEAPTVSLVERVLDEAGLDGVWTLRESRRIRKKGRGRFGTIRLESRGGAKSVRMWCKPKGNDTGFEYSLYPPAGTDAELAFRILARVHPITLCVPESPDLRVAVRGRLLDAPIPFMPPPVPEKVFEVEEVREEPQADAAGHVEATKEALPAAEPVDQSPTPEATEEVLVAEEDEQWVSFADEGDGIPELAIEDGSDLWDREVADRALIAIAFVAEGGFARRSEASRSIIRHLGMARFAGGGSDRYKSVQGSMRGLTMAMAKKWRYIERVKYSAEGGSGPSSTVKGYKITAKGQRRLEAIREGFGERTRLLLNRPAPTPIQDDGLTAAVAGAPVTSISIEAIKSMVERHEEANRQVREHDEVLQAMEADIRSMDIEIEGLSAVVEERKRRVAELQAEIEEIESKRAVVEERAAKKKEERRQWSDMRAPYALERDRIESILVGRGRC